MQSKRSTEESTDRGVSPVIGVILMVAITVILAAVIAAFVLDIGPGDTDPQAAISVDGEGTSEVSVELLSVDQGDGIIVLSDDDGEDVLGSTTTTGDTVNIDDATVSDDELVVLAFSGDAPSDNASDTDVDSLDSDASIDIAVIETIEYDG